MDPMMFKAARDGNVIDLLNLLEGDPLILERLVTASADTPLHVAAMLGHLDFVKEVIKHKSNVVEYVKEPNQQGYSPIHLAAAHGHADVVRMLIEVSSELCCIKGRDGMTPLHCASVKGRAETMSLLLSASPLCVLEETERGETALHIAAKNNQLDALRVLVEWLRRSDTLVVINSKDDDGNTVLHLAAARKNHQAIQLLRSCNDGASEVLEVNAINKRGLTALDLFMLCPCESGIVHADAERLFRGIGAARDGVPSDDITSTLRPYQNHNQVSYQQNTIAGHTNIVADPSTSSRQDTMLGDDWVTWRNYFKFQFDRDTPSHVREALLVVAVLIAAATYQTAQSIPTWGQQEGSDKFERIRESRNQILFFLYSLSNTVGFLVSLDMILVLTSKFPMCWGLVVAVHAMAINYTISIVGIAPSGMKIASAVLCIILVLAIRLTSRCIRTRSRRQIHRSSAERLA